MITQKSVMIFVFFNPEIYLFACGGQERKIFSLKFCHPATAGPWSVAERGGMFAERTGGKAP